MGSKRRAKISQDFFTPTSPVDDGVGEEEPTEEVVQEVLAETVEETSVPQRLQKTVTQPQAKTLSSQNTKTSNSQSSSTDKQQVTVYLNPITVDEITITQLKLKRMIGLRGHSISNSAIVEAALQVVFNDLKANGKNSALAQYLQSVEE